MNMSTIVFGLLSVLCLVGLIVVAALPTRILQKGKLWKVVQPETLIAILLPLFIAFAIVSAFCHMNRCENCNNVVASEYCGQCGTRNDEYKEQSPSSNGENICPNCKVIVYTPYCGDCGAKIDGGEE